MRIISQVRHAKEQSLLLQSRQQQQQHKTLFPLKKQRSSHESRILLHEHYDWIRIPLHARFQLHDFAPRGVVSTAFCQLRFGKSSI